MASGVEELLNMLFSMIDEARNMPLSSEKCIIERDRALDLLEEIKGKFPVELSEARRLLDSKEEYITAAKREADLIRKQAEDRARQMLSEDELMAQARQKSGEIMRTTEARSRELRRAANDYCEDALRRTEEAVTEACEEIKRSRAKFRAAANATAAAGTAAQPTGGGTRAVYDAEADKS